MNSLRAVVHELAGLFVDDGALALQIVAVILLAGVASMLIPGAPLVTGAVLLFGCLGALLLSVARAAR